MRTAVVTLNYRQAELTVACLTAVAAMNPAPDLVVCCDNGSDETELTRILDEARLLFGEDAVLRTGREASAEMDGERGRTLFVLIENGANLGFARGNNPGIRLALTLGMEAVWLLNNDAEPEPGALGALKTCAGASVLGRGVQILGATVLERGTDMLQCAGGFRFSPLTTVARPVHGGHPLAQLSALHDPELDYVYGASLFALAEVFKTVGFLDEEFFLFYEELEFCRRATNAGFRMGWCRAAKVRHHHSATIGRDDSVRGFAASYHETRSLLRYLGKHHHVLLPFALAVRCTRFALAGLLKGRGFKLQAFFKALSDHLRSLPDGPLP